MTAHQHPIEVEWVGGLVRSPTAVENGAAPFRPHLFYWLSPDGTPLGCALGVPGQEVSLACESLRTAIDDPMYGVPGAPVHVRVASPKVAEALRRSFPELTVSCRATPEIDAMAASMIDGRTLAKMPMPAEIRDDEELSAMFRERRHRDQAPPAAPSGDCRTAPKRRGRFYSISIPIDSLGSPPPLGASLDLATAIAEGWTIRELPMTARPARSRNAVKRARRKAREGRKRRH